MELLSSQIPVFGSLVNALGALAGGLIGLLIHSRLPERVTSISFHALGLFTLVAGISMALSSNNMLIMVFSIVSGSILGEIIGLDQKLKGISSHHPAPADGTVKNSFTEACLVASLLYCGGSMGILGAIEEGLGGFPNLLMAKALLDFIASIALASSLGAGVILASAIMFFFQGSITLFAGSLQTFLTQPIIDEISGVGGLMLIGIALGLLEIKRIRVMNMLPSILIAFALALFFTG
jgi:hypothetical protein